MDLNFENHGSVILIRHLTPLGKTWLDQNVSAELSFGGAVACEPRYAQDVADGAAADGLEVGAP